jgi:RsiW-degrading membrane proteinase PrsW (M82 family)
MSWQPFLRRSTRDPKFLWRLAIGILVIGVLLGIATRWLPDSVAESLIGGRIGELSEHYDRVGQLAEADDWWGVWKLIPKGMWLATMPGPALIAGLAGACWLVFLIQAGQPGSKDGIRVWLALLAVVLGVLSVWPTLFAIYYQEHRWGIRESADVAEGLRFYILGVGLREELAKLLMFMPLVPLIIRRGSQREAMLVAACVGLGFAMEENVSYFTSNPACTIDRFLLSNFLHMSLTGLAGLAICRAIWWPKQYGSEAIAIVLLAIVLHGVFDSLIALPALMDYSLGSFIIYILLAYRFFHELRSWWQPRGETISLTATFVAAVSLVAAITFVYFAAATNITLAAAAIIAPGISTGIFVYMFLREMPESLVE